jgi:hypothetical protein
MTTTPAPAAMDLGAADSPESMTPSLYPGKGYSPYAQRDFPSNVYWGETHLHTGLSLDAGLFGNVLGHADAYKLARGEEITASSGIQIKLGRPLDWLVITDHSDMMGIATDIQEGAPNILEWHEGFKKGGKAAGEAAFDLITHFAQMKLPEKMVSDYSPGAKVYDDLWYDIIDTAERFNDPGRSFH